MGLMKRFDGPDYAGKRPGQAAKISHIPGQGETKQTPQIAPGDAKKAVKSAPGPIMGPYINKVVGLLGPGEFRYFETVYTLINREITIERSHLIDLLGKLNYGIHEGTHAGKKTLIVEGGPILEPVSTPEPPFMGGKGVFKYFNVYIPPSKKEQAKAK